MCLGCVLVEDGKRESSPVALDDRRGGWSGVHIAAAPCRAGVPAQLEDRSHLVGVIALGEGGVMRLGDGAT